MTDAMHIIRVDGSVSSTLNKTNTTLSEVQQAVDGYIETVPHFTMWEGEKCQVYANEDGKSLGKELNKKATQLWYEEMNVEVVDDYLVGNVVILTGKARLK